MSRVIAAIAGIAATGCVMFSTNVKPNLLLTGARPSLNYAPRIDIVIRVRPSPKHLENNTFGYFSRASELERFIATVPREARPTMRQAFRANRRSLQDLVAEVQAARMDAAGLVDAEPFDRAAFEAALAIERDRSLTLQATVHDVIAETIEQLPAGLRTEMAERWRDRR